LFQSCRTTTTRTTTGLARVPYGKWIEIFFFDADVWFEGGGLGGFG